MNPHIGAAMWIIAMLVGFVIWWPIGAAILASITFTAFMQQLTGYQLNPPPQRQPLPRHWSEVEIIEPPMKQINQTKAKRITRR